jgi:hypothetical protein
MDTLLAAAVEIDITPAVGDGFDGYGARTGMSTGVHDPLLAQLLLLRAGDQQAAIISMDLLGVSLGFTKRVRSGIENAIGVPPACTMIAGSHTHAGPSGFLPAHPGIKAKEDPDKQRFAEQKLIGAAMWASNQLQPARLGAATGRVTGIGLNRNNPEQLVDDQVIVLRVDAESGSPLAVLMNYGCHPTVLGYDNLLYSADFPGAARAALRKIYTDTAFMFANGASGDISTRFTRRDQSYSEVERLGRLLAGEVLKVMQWVMPAETPTIAGITEVVDLDFRSFPQLDEGQRELERLQAELEELKAAGASHGAIRKAITRVEGAGGQLLLAEALVGRTGTRSEVQAIRVGELALVGLPGEPFTRTVLDTKKHSPVRHTAVVSYANDYQGYFPDLISIQEGSYEALISPYGASAAEALQDTAGRTLAKVAHV